MHQQYLDTDSMISAKQQPAEVQRHYPRNYNGHGKKLGPELHKKVPTETALPFPNVYEDDCSPFPGPFDG